MQHHALIITGPTAVGKTDLALCLCDYLQKNYGTLCAIINADSGQFYEPLTIGTAKPDWKNEKVPHYLFDWISVPRVTSALEYQDAVREICQQLWADNVLPVIVGGSGFYIKSLFFSLKEFPKKRDVVIDDTHVTWEALHAIDPKRARCLHKNDRYRLRRALELWYECDILPSSAKPVFDSFIASPFFISVRRDRTQLHERIIERVIHMLDNGFIEEVHALPMVWKEFVEQRNIIGYPEVLKGLSARHFDKKCIAEEIALQTRAYAKRQETFLRSMKELLSASCSSAAIHELNLTLLPVSLYLKQLGEDLSTFLKSHT